MEGVSALGVPPPLKKNFCVRISFLDQGWRKSILGKIFGEGVGTPSAPKFWDPIIFQLGIDVWTFCEQRIKIGCCNVVLDVCEYIQRCIMDGRRDLVYFRQKAAKKDTFGDVAPKRCALGKKCPVQTLTSWLGAITWHRPRGARFTTELARGRQSVKIRKMAHSGSTENFIPAVLLDRFFSNFGGR